MPSRIILLTEGLDGQDGGIQRVSRSVLAALGRDEVPSWIWSSNDVSGTVTGNGRNSVRIRCFGRRYLAMALAALVARDVPPDCRKIFCWHLALAPIAMALAWRLKCPFEVFLHGVEAWRPLRYIQHIALGRVAKLAANSHYTIERFRQAHPSFAGIPAVVIPLGVFNENREGISTTAGSEEPYFVTVTRFSEIYKGEETLLRAFAEVKRRYPKTRLVCVGDGPRRGEWERFCAEQELRDGVRFTGRVTDAELVRLYSRSLGFVLLSEEEGFGLVYAEAMFCGKPCIAANAGAVPELVEHEKNGLLVPSQDVMATVAAMERLLAERGLAVRLGEAGRQKALEQYTKEQFEQRLTNYLAV